MTFDPTSLDDDAADFSPEDDSPPPDLMRAEYEGERWCWSCPRCGCFHAAEEDVRRTVQACDDCEEQVYVPDGI